MPRAIDLEGAIEEIIDEGIRDPAAITRLLAERHGEAWVWGQLMARAEEFIAEISRRLLARHRPTSTALVLRPGDSGNLSRIRARLFWIPSVGYKPLSEVTSQDMRARAVFYENLSVRSRQAQHWCLNVADLMDSEGVRTLAELRVELPPLPSTMEVTA